VKRTFVALAALFILAAACNHDSSPTEPVLQTFGTLSGVVTIGPNCPSQQPNDPCPTPPGAYAARKVQIYDAAHANLLRTVDIDAQGSYIINLAPGDYVVDLKPNGADRSPDVPVKVTIRANLATKLDIAIDTGLR
jgi:hypothetical protein